MKREQEQWSPGEDLSGGAQVHGVHGVHGDDGGMDMDNFKHDEIH